MDNFELKAPAGATKKKRVKGRGIGCGKGGTSGKGNKGQNARAGGGVRPGFEGGQMPLFRRIARRGFSNYPFGETYAVVNVQSLEKAYANGETVNLATLSEKGLINAKDSLVKILGSGTLTKKLVVEMEKVSASAREKITAAGGSVAGTAASE